MAKEYRDVKGQMYNESTTNLYSHRIQQKNHEAETVDEMTKRLERKEAEMLAKLQQTYTHEKNVIQKLN